MHDLLLSKIFAEAGSEAAVDIDGNSVVFTSRDGGGREKLVDAVSKTIVEQYEDKLISKLINRNYFYFNLPDKKIIFKKALRYADQKDAFSALVGARLREYLETADKVVIDGFVKFRLKDYRRELEEIIDKAVDDFMADKEYRDFVRLLKYFVEIQTPKYDLINIVPKNGEYYVYDDTGKDVTATCLTEFTREGGGESAASDDVLISALISLAPRRVFLHKPGEMKNAELLTTIHQVFEKKITTCDGCELCDR
jgi:putative sporulation protein YtxC